MDGDTGLECEVPDGLIQQMTRLRDGAGESIHALVQAEIPAQDNQAVIHLAFCPPLDAGRR